MCNECVYRQAIINHMYIFFIEDVFKEYSLGHITRHSKSFEFLFSFKRMVHNSKPTTLTNICKKKTQRFML